MKAVYKVLAYAMAVEVVVQATAIAVAMFGLTKWIDGGGVLDKAEMESHGSSYPEVIGFAIHGINGQMLVPLIALLLLVSSFFAKVPGAVKWAGVVLALVVVQILLGVFGHAVTALGALHGLNALLLFSAAVVAARLARKVTTEPAASRAAGPAAADVAATA
ncbi:hypothetical protein [Micromonospora pisi]|nr:hypothetical protein [Micromonospora pisi]